jgi:hypothetical protein
MVSLCSILEKQNLEEPQKSLAVGVFSIKKNFYFEIVLYFWKRYENI